MENCLNRNRKLKSRYTNPAKNKTDRCGSLKPRSRAGAVKRIEKGYVRVAELVDACGKRVSR